MAWHLAASGHYRIQCWIIANRISPEKHHGAFYVEILLILNLEIYWNMKLTRPRLLWCEYHSTTSSGSCTMDRGLWVEYHIYGLMQDWGNSFANAQELPQFCAKPSSHVWVACSFYLRLLAVVVCFTKDYCPSVSDVSSAMTFVLPFRNTSYRKLPPVNESLLWPPHMPPCLLLIAPLLQWLCVVPWMWG